MLIHHLAKNELLHESIQRLVQDTKSKQSANAFDSVMLQDILTALTELNQTVVSNISDHRTESNTRFSMLADMISEKHTKIDRVDLLLSEMREKTSSIESLIRAIPTDSHRPAHASYQEPSVENVASNPVYEQTKRLLEESRRNALEFDQSKLGISLSLQINNCLFCRKVARKRPGS
jgi:hypothetical protein